MHLGEGTRWRVKNERMGDTLERHEEGPSVSSFRFVPPWGAFSRVRLACCGSHICFCSVVTPPSPSRRFRPAPCLRVLLPRPGCSSAALSRSVRSPFSPFLGLPTFPIAIPVFVSPCLCGPPCLPHSLLSPIPSPPLPSIPIQISPSRGREGAERLRGDNPKDHIQGTRRGTSTRDKKQTGRDKVGMGGEQGRDQTEGPNRGTNPRDKIVFCLNSLRN